MSGSTRTNMTIADMWQDDAYPLFNEAHVTRAVIDQAKGVIIGLAHCTADQAGSELAAASEDHNVPLGHIARAVIDLASETLGNEAQSQAIYAIARARWGDLSID